MLRRLWRKYWKFVPAAALSLSLVAGTVAPALADNVNHNKVVAAQGQQHNEKKDKKDKKDREDHDKQCKPKPYGKRCKPPEKDDSEN